MTVNVINYVRVTTYKDNVHSTYKLASYVAAAMYADTRFSWVVFYWMLSSIIPSKDEHLNC